MPIAFIILRTMLSLSRLMNASLRQKTDHCQHRLYRAPIEQWLLTYMSACVYVYFEEQPICKMYITSMPYESAREE